LRGQKVLAPGAIEKRLPLQFIATIVQFERFCAFGGGGGTNGTSGICITFKEAQRVGSDLTLKLCAILTTTETRCSDCSWRHGYQPTTQQRVWPTNDTTTGIEK
jgi:hypothetical protein